MLSETQKVNVLTIAVPFESTKASKTATFLQELSAKFVYEKWGRLDSNQRNPKVRDLQSLAIAAMRHPQMRKIVYPPFTVCRLLLRWDIKLAGERT